MRNSIYITLFFGLCYFLNYAQHDQKLPIDYLKTQISNLKKDPRGPYKRIRWFCKDGSVREPRDPCPDSIGGGIQHASYKDEIVTIGDKHHIFFGDILAFTDKTDFWDANHQQSRLKQYQLSKYLASVDDGWITRRSRYYRGAIQSEDEEAWGIEFYHQLLSKDAILEKYYYLIRQSLRDIPHDGDTNLAQLIRSDSKLIAEEVPSFMDIRIKIHGRPDRNDIQLVNSFLTENKKTLSTDIIKKLNSLEDAMYTYYAPIDFKGMANKMKQLRSDADLSAKIQAFLNTSATVDAPNKLAEQIAVLLCDIRTQITAIQSSKDRLLLLDFSNDLEGMLLRNNQESATDNLNQLIHKTYILSKAAAGTGLIETWEWNAIDTQLKNITSREKISIEELRNFLRLSQSIVEWSAAKVKAVYNPVVPNYTTFEPKAAGFIDDRIRTSVALPLGESVSKLSDYLAQKINLSNQVFQVENQGSFKGLNPGYAMGELVVIKEATENMTIDPSKIYVFSTPPSDLKPVAGILTVSEGNLVSHVQLLARNLGIPNATLSDSNLESLLTYQGKQVFFAVSPSGTVILKEATQLSDIEKGLFSKNQRSQQKIEVATENIRLDVTDILNMRNLSEKDSGKLCGPKAANLGALKNMFPDNVVEGLVIPFGIFKSHMNQPMPNTNGSFWEFVKATFENAELQTSQGVAATKIEAQVLSQLKLLETAILRMPLKPEFIKQIQSQFKEVFGKPLGQTPVFLRSDTNMEDLKEFTGAGLNLTLFNVVEEIQILQGIKRVWASPFTERSFKWRQSYLTNPENVYPSILIIPSVDVTHSGVLITKGINVGKENDITAAFSRGAGGAVDGQLAETWLITQNNSFLLAPARQNEFLRLPKTGGTKTHYTTFEAPILNENNKQGIRSIVSSIRATNMGKSKKEYNGAFDVELGFENDKLWLFQIRPFVENKQATSSGYLQSISPKINENQTILTTEKL